MHAPHQAGQLPFYCPFAQVGWGYGLLLFDMVERYLVFSFAMGGTAYTPGSTQFAHSPDLAAALL